MKTQKTMLQTILIVIGLCCATIWSCPCPPCPACYTVTGSYPNCGCSYDCKTYLCESCVGGNCQVCGDNPNQFCCDVVNGTCCNSSTDCCVNWDCVTNSCTGGPETAYFCNCTSGGGDGLIECSVQKIYHTCICNGPSCQNTLRQKWAIGSTYSERDPSLGRHCNGALYCPVTSLIGVGYIGENYCGIAYSGCD